MTYMNDKPVPWMHILATPDVRQHDQTPCLPGTCCRLTRPALGAMELPRYQLSCVDTRGEARLEYEPLMRARRRGEFTLPELQAMMSSGSCAQAPHGF